MNLLKRILQKSYFAIILLFLYAPILTLVVLSFNKSKSRAVWGGFTFDWYVQMFQSSKIMTALYNSLSIALISSVLATLIGVLACIGIGALSRRSRTFWLTANNIPMLNAEIVTGLSLMICFGAFGISLGYGTILVSHVAFCIPYVILSVMPRLKKANRGVYEAALDLGASPAQAFFKVVLPDLMPGIVAGFLLSFTMSLDDFVISYFVRGRGVDTLSTLIYTQVRRGIVPSMYALSTVIFVVVLVFLMAQNFLPKRLEKWRKRSKTSLAPAAAETGSPARATGAKAAARASEKAFPKAEAPSTDATGPTEPAGSTAGDTDNQHGRGTR